MGKFGDIDFEEGIPTRKRFKEMARGKSSYLGFPIERVDVENGNIDMVVAFFENIKATKSKFRNKVLFSISGYDFDKRELYEIKEVVDWIRLLIPKAPHIFYYIDEESWSFILCCLAEELTSFANTEDKQLDIHEINRRILTGEGVPMYQNFIKLDGKVIDGINMSIKMLGSEVGDMMGANMVLHKLNKNFTRVGGK